MDESIGWIDLAVLLSATSVATLAGLAAKKRSRSPLGWAAASFFLSLPILVLFQSPVEEKGDHPPPRWSLRFSLTAFLFLVAAVMGELPFDSQTVAAIEAQLGRILNPGEPLLVDGPRLESGAGVLQLPGSLKAPISLGIVGMGLGCLVLHQTVPNVIKMAVIASLIGAMSSVLMTQIAIRDWLANPNDLPQYSRWPFAIASIGIFWSSVLVARLSSRSRAA